MFKDLNVSNKGTIFQTPENRFQFKKIEILILPITQFKVKKT